MIKKLFCFPEEQICIDLPVTLNCLIIDEHFLCQDMNIINCLFYFIYLIFNKFIYFIFKKLFILCYIFYLKKKMYFALFILLFLIVYFLRLAILPVSKARTNKFYIYRQCTYIVYILQ